MLGLLSLGFHPSVMLGGAAGERGFLWEVALKSEPFRYEAGSEVRYIDFERGDDRADGASPESAWKHHPWDRKASDQAARFEGSVTYVFKRGVIYRGSLHADESGVVGNPIRLTSDPDWGEGEASFYGSIGLEGGWKRLGEGDTFAIPESEKVWYQDIEVNAIPRALWEVSETGVIKRISLARTPNWTFSNPDDFKAEWWEWEQVGTGKPEGSSIVMNRTMDSDKLKGKDYRGATVWSEWIPVMGTSHAAKIEFHDAESGEIYFTGFFENTNRMEPGNRYFIEGLPEFLDSDGEFYFQQLDTGKGRLYVRLHDGKNPNETRIEVPQELSLMDLTGQSHIEISGLTFRFTNSYDPAVRPRRTPEAHHAVIQSFGSGTDLTIKYCLFEHVSQAIYLKAYGDGDWMDDVRIEDNQLHQIDRSAISVEDGTYFWRKEAGLGQLGGVSILRNQLKDIGLRPERKFHGHAIVVVFPEHLQIAGNHLETIGGAGIFVFGGKGSGQQHASSFSRMLIHNNFVKDPLLNSNDWGGIETWQGGPAYVFNNTSINPGGYWHWKHRQTLESGKRDHASARFGFAYYLDGAFKNYVFNNLAIGKNNDLNSPLGNTAAFQEIHGFNNTYFHNTAYQFLVGSRRQAPEAGRNLYLSNLWIDMTETVFWHSRPTNATLDDNHEHVGDIGTDFAYETLAYANNAVENKPLYFGVFEASGYRHPTPESFSTALQRRGALQSQTGWFLESDSAVDSKSEGDFIPRADSSTIDQGVKVFVPWALSGVVGEWHFFKNNKQPEVIFDEHWNMAEFYTNREDYHHKPFFNLEVIHASEDAFVNGVLEDWTQGALRFDGKRYARLKHADLAQDIDYKVDGKTYQWPGSKVPTVDMRENSFSIELVLRSKIGHTGGLLVGKGESADSGYRLSIDEQGRLKMDLIYQGEFIATRRSETSINDGEWHHVFIEIDRDIVTKENRPITIYLNGKADNGDWNGIMPTKYIQFSNQSDFYIGGGKHRTAFEGEIDFLRISQGTLRDAHTTIEELYAWQFDGPQFRDFYGNETVGKSRDVGAFEYSPSSSK